MEIFGVCRAWVERRISFVRAVEVLQALLADVAVVADAPGTLLPIVADGRRVLLLVL